MYDWKIIEWKFELIDIELVDMRVQSSDRITFICVYSM